MKWSEVKEKKSFCILPFIQGATLTDGSMPLCCVAESHSPTNLNKSTIEDYWNSEYVRSVRTKMLEGSPLKECSRCYEEEKNSYRSHRVIENKAWEEKLGSKGLESILESVDSQGKMSNEIISVDLRLGNTCNLQCVMCQPRDSSKWKSASQGLMRELSHKKLFSQWREKNNIKVEMFEWYKNENFWVHLKSCLPSLREIIIGGGEPMLIKEHLEFIKYCSESGEAKHIHLRYHTNLTVFPEEMIPYWNCFEKVEFYVSVDGMDEVGNYVRYPSRWSEVSENLRLIDELGDNVWLRLLYSVHALNVHHLPPFLNWVKEQKFKKEKLFSELQAFVSPGLVHWPQYLNIKVLPQNYKDFVTQRWESLRAQFNNEAFDKYEGVMEFMNSQDWSDKLPMTRNYISALDKTRKTDFYKDFPELSEHLLS